MSEKITRELNVRAIKNGILITTLTTKTSLVRKIQLLEGETPCFRTNVRDSCKETCNTCEWANDCKNYLIAAWKR